MPQYKIGSGAADLCSYVKKEKSINTIRKKLERAILGDSPFFCQKHLNLYMHNAILGM